ncbi:MAG: HU family DNA-binding protein [Tannerella sp.]|jgi:nucleoid DNA-binding protein|nr:HU family DNA-binding protein [Tannerella sp.]
MKEVELTAELSLRLNWKKQKVDDMLVALGNVMGEQLGDLNSICIRGLGDFEVRKKVERFFSNPENGRAGVFPPRFVAGYKPASALKAYLETLDGRS